MTVDDDKPPKTQVLAGEHVQQLSRTQPDELAQIAQIEHSCVRRHQRPCAGLGFAVQQLWLEQHSCSKHELCE